MTKPPPYDSAPTLNATRHSAAHPPKAGNDMPSGSNDDAGRRTRTIASTRPARQNRYRDPRPDQYRGHRPRGEVERPPDAGGSSRTGTRPGTRDEAGSRVDGDGRHGRTGAGRGSQHVPVRRRAEQECRQRKDRDQTGGDEADPADQTADGAAQSPGAVDGELGRCRARQQIHGGECVSEVLFGYPGAAPHT